MRALGPYMLEKELGRGAAGAVFLARHRVTGATRAVKVLEATDPEAVVRFEREAAALGRLGAADVVAVHELLRDGRRIALVLDLMVGSLRDRLRERGPLPWAEAYDELAGLGQRLGKALKTSGLDGEAERRVVLAPLDPVLRTCSRGIGASPRLVTDKFGPALAPLEEIVPGSSESAAVVALFRYDERNRHGIPDRNTPDGVRRALDLARSRLEKDPVLAAALLRLAAQDATALARTGSPLPDELLGPLVDSVETAASRAADALAARKDGGDPIERTREERLVEIHALGALREASWLQVERFLRSGDAEVRKRHADDAARLLRQAVARTTVPEGSGRDEDARSLVTLGFLFERTDLVDQGKAASDPVAKLASVWRAYLGRAAGPDEVHELDLATARAANPHTLAQIQVLRALVDRTPESAKAAGALKKDVDDWLVGGLRRDEVLKELEAQAPR